MLVLRPGRADTVRSGLSPRPLEDNILTDSLSAAPARVSTILLVDDEPDILESLGDLFAAAIPNVKVVTAPSGDAGLKELQKHSIDLIISDFKMPGMNGLQFLEKSREVAPKVPRIMMTAFPDLEIAIAAINEARIETFFTKPLDPDKILGVVNKVLANRQAKGQSDQALARALEEARRKAAGGKA